MRHCHRLAGIARYVVIRIRARPGPASSGAAETRTDLAILAGAGQHPGARERVRCLNAGSAGRAAGFCADVVSADAGRDRALRAAAAVSRSWDRHGTPERLRPG
jgi:hypothetical protein